MEERLQKYLARSGVASRRKAETLIAEGHVTVNGVVVRKMGVKVDADRDEIRVDTQVVRPRVARARRGAAPRPVPTDPALPSPPAEGVYFMLHKPKGVLSTVTDDRGRTTVLDLVPRIRERVYPVGRLDEDSEGLLLLTNDGNLTHLLTHPSVGVTKVYDLRLRGEVTDAEVLQVERGVWLSEGRSGPARMKVKRMGRDITHVVLTISEGKNRELRRIFARLRHPVLSLRRVAVGPLKLGSLPRGSCRRLLPQEVGALYAAARAALAGEKPPPPPATKRGDRGPGRGPARGPVRGPGRPPGRGPARGPGRRPSRNQDGKPARGTGRPPKAGPSRGRPSRSGPNRGPGGGRGGDGGRGR